MKDISSHPKSSSVKMRVLIISALFAVSAAAPSGLYASVVFPAVKAVPVPSVIPTISPGDIQAAAIDAQVQAQDQAQAAADKARELAEQANENVNEKVITDSTVASEQNVDAFWSVEDQKWQAIDALKTAEAKIDGAIASNANLLAKSAISGVVPYVAAVGPINPIVAPIPPVVYTPYVATSYSSQSVVSTQEKTEAKDENKDAVEVAAVKTAEPAKQEQAEGEKKAESETPAVKTAENETPAVVGPSLIASPVFLANHYRYDIPVPGAAPIVAQPILSYASTVNGVLAPTFVKTAW